MSQYNDNVQHHTTAKEEHPGLIHKIADKLGVHKKDDHNDSKLDKHSDMHSADPSNQASHLHDNDPHRVHDKDAQPGVVHKMADKVGIHSDHHDMQEHHVSKTEHHARDAHAHQIGDMGGYPIYQQGARDNDPNHQDSKDSPGFKEKIKSKLGMDTDDNKSMDHHTKTEEAHLFGTTTIPRGHDNYTTGQAHTSTSMRGTPSSTQHGYGGDDNAGAVNTASTNYTTTQAHPTNKEDSPGFREKLKSKLGMSSDHQKKTDGDSSSVLPRMTPQAGVGSVYSSSLHDNSPGSTMTGDTNHPGYSTTTTRDAGTSGRTHQN